MAKRARKRRPDERPAEILEAALELFSERGFSATRLEDVASHAGLSKAAIYLYFEDKTALLKAIVQEMVGANIDAVAARVAAHRGPVAPVLKELLATFASLLAGTPLPAVIKLVVSESRAHPEIGRLYLDNVIRRAIPIGQSLIKRGIAAGEFRKVDPRLAVKSLIGPMVLAAMWRSVLEPLGAEPLDIEALARSHADIVMRGLQKKRRRGEP